jgi:acetylglutamate kinase
MSPDPERQSLSSRHVAGIARSLPFMQALHGQTVVIVYAGRAGSTAQSRIAFSQDVALLALTGVRPVVIHGEMPRVDAAGQRGQSEAAIVHAAWAAMAEANLELVRLIGSHGVKTLGVTGLDGGLMAAGSESDGSHVSPLKQLDAGALASFRENGMVPVVMSLAADEGGQNRLLRPERVGSLIAQRAAGMSLVLMVEPAVLGELGDLVGLSGVTELAQWLAEHPTAQAAQHVREALDALTHGVQNVHLVDIEQPQSLVDELLTEDGTGIVLCRRGNADLLSETQRYFADSTSALRRGFSVERKMVVRF